MGKERTTQRGTTQVAGAPGEAELTGLQLERMRAAQPGMIQAQTGGLNLINQLLTGQGLPGFLQGLPGGISPELTSEISQQAVADLGPAFQTQGILDSGVAPVAAARVAGDVRRQSAQFNIQNLVQLLQMALGGQAQVQQPILGQSALLGQRLAGLRSTTATGQVTTPFNFNPFLKAGAALVGAGIGSFGGPGGMAAGATIGGSLFSPRR